MKPRYSNCPLCRQLVQIHKVEGKWKLKAHHYEDMGKAVVCKNTEVEIKP